MEHAEKHPAPKKGVVVMLPRRAKLFHGRLELALPPDFMPEPKRPTQYAFAGSRSGLRLVVMQMAFKRPLRELTADDLQEAFRRLVAAETAPEISRGYLRHSPTLTARWQQPQTVLHLIQVRQLVYLLLLEHITPENEAYIAPILSTISVKTE